MDKFKTSEMGKALKKVYRGEMKIEESVALARDDVARHFAPVKELPPLEEDRDIGFLGDSVGTCPLCHAEVRRTKFGYGCSGYREGCKFGFHHYICGRALSLRNAKQMLETGFTSKIRGFVSPRTGKSFDAFLKIADGKCVFDFDGPRQENHKSES